MLSQQGPSSTARLEQRETRGLVAGSPAGCCWINVLIPREKLGAQAPVFQGAPEERLGGGPGTTPFPRLPPRALGHTAAGLGPETFGSGWWSHHRR